MSIVNHGSPHAHPSIFFLLPCSCSISTCFLFFFFFFFCFSFPFLSRQTSSTAAVEPLQPVGVKGVILAYDLLRPYLIDSELGSEFTRMISRLRQGGPYGFRKGERERWVGRRPARGRVVHTKRVFVPGNLGNHARYPFRTNR